MIIPTQIKPYLKAVGILLLLQVLYRTLFFFLMPIPPGGYYQPVAAYFICVFLFPVCASSLPDSLITLSTVVILIYSLYKILLGLSYQKRSTSGRLALLLAFIFIYEFLCLAGASFGPYPHSA